MILVTGATGLVGSHLIKQLVQQNRQVRALYRSAIPSFEGSDKVEWIKGDILDVFSLEDALQNVQQVYHCAAIVSFSPKEKNNLLHTNIEGTANMVNACIDAGIQKLLFVSSVSALGRIRENVMIDETMNWTEETSNSEYGKSKYLAEMEVWRGIAEGLNAVIVNPSIILGAADWNKGSTAVFKKAYDEFAYYTDGVTGFVDINDVVQAMILLMESDVAAQRFILNGDNVSYRELFTQIANAFDRKPPYKKASPLLAEIVWRVETVRCKLSGSKPLLTKETTKTAQAKVYFSNKKLSQYFPSFQYTSLPNSVARICNELKLKYNLP
jgi:nucleoside-diphosphate-sugar epimerase